MELLTKASRRQIAIRGGPFTANESKGQLDYCLQDVDAITLLLKAMKNHVRFPYCLIRGRYMWSVALMERPGIPIDLEMLELLGNKCFCLDLQDNSYTVIVCHQYVVKSALYF